MKISGQSMMRRTEKWLGVLNLGGRFAHTTSFEGLKTSLPRNLLRTFTQVVNIPETHDTGIENISAYCSCNNPRRIFII